MCCLSVPGSRAKQPSASSSRCVLNLASDPFSLSLSILPLNLPLDYFAGLFKRKQKNERYKTKIRNRRKQKKSLLAARKVFITTSRSH